MSANRPFEVRDHREPGWYWVDNIIMDHYAALIGPHALAVYHGLARYANAHGQSYPSLRRLQSLLRMSRPTVLKALETLKGHGLIAMEKRQSPYGDFESNIYTLANVRGGKGDLPPGKGGLLGVVKEVYHGGKGGLPEEDLLEEDLKEEKNICASDAARPYSNAFLNFWETYPVKKGKGAAWKSWKRQKLDKQEEGIVASVLAHLANDPDWKAGYIPHPATFLNGARWEDELPTPGHAPTNGVSEYARHLDANGLLCHPDHPGHEFAARPGTRQVYCYTCNVDLGFALPAKE